LLLITTSIFSYAQIYNNEWIDYSKTYYKFSVGATGLYRISQPALSAIGLGSTAAQNFQLWRNGVEVPLYTSVSSGTLSPTDYLEFYGLMNDGTTDTKLYKYDSLQMCTQWSLYTDTAAYFLTVNNTSATKRMAGTVNNVAGNTLAAEPYFIDTLSKFYRDNLNQGFGEDLGDIVCSSSYETAEGWSSYYISSGNYTAANNSNLKVCTSGPAATVDAVIAGNAGNTRSVSISLNGTTIITDNISNYNIDRLHIGSIPLSSFSGDVANFQFTNIYNSSNPTDQIVIADYKLTYPRQFDFGGQSQFTFQLPASDTGNYLTISNFNYGNGTPVLYDLTNNLRLTGIVSSGIVQFALPASVTARNLVLLSTDPGSINTVSSFTQRNFINYSASSNQGNYLIISDSLLYNDGNGNNYVANYQQYRSSVAGGSYNVKVYDIQQLIDQFAFGVKHHPSAVRNFSAYALANFSVQPQFIFLIGKGLDYEEFRNHEADPNVNGLALIPTFGWPGSDNILTATRTGEYATIATGRLSAVSGTEIAQYLNKVKEFELAQKTDSQSIDSKAWMKNMALLTGGLSDPSLSALITSYMQGYQSTASDTLFGASVYQFNQNSGLSTAAGTNKTIEDLFSNGLSLLTYFGHSSPNSIEFNLDNPENYNNPGKYPAIIINGCQAGDLYEFDTLRAINGGTLSDKFTFANERGSIAFIASSNFGLPTELDYINSEFYRNLCNSMYGQPLGSIMKTTMTNVYNTYFSDYIAQSHVEQVNLHGDPAIRLNPQSAPDYTINDSLVSFNPTVISVADNKVVITARMLNIGEAINDSLPVLIQHKFPDNTIETLFNGKIKPLEYEDSIVLTLNINPLKDTGINQLIVTLDPNNIILELSETNNTVTVNFTITTNQIRPIWPYPYAIVSDPNVSLYGSTANPTIGVNQYVMEMDTTALFNSPLLTTKNVSDSGGVIKFTPGITYSDSTVYYWRLAVGPINANTNWLSSSFVFITGGDTGFNQSHYYQYTNNTFNNMNIDSASRSFEFTNITRDLLLRTGVYPYYGWDQINMNIGDNLIDYYGCKYGSLQFYVYDSLTLAPWKNYNNDAGTSGRFGSYPICEPYPGGYRYFFEFPYNDTAYRRKAMQFFDSIPKGDYVSVTNLGWTSNTTFINQWMADTARLGSGISLWNKFHNLGLNDIDSFTSNLPFMFFFKAGEPATYPIYQSVGPTVQSQIATTFYIPGKQVFGTVQSPMLGTVKAWKHFKWNELASDSLQATFKVFDIVGLDSIGNVDTLASIYNSKDTDISFINAASYPNLGLVMYNQDSLHAQATQLKNWMLTASIAPEGAVSPNILLSTKDTLSVNDTLHFRVAFENVSNVSFDSIKVRLTITDANGNTHIYNNLAGGIKIRPLAPSGDTAIIYYDIPMQSYPGQNQLILEVNPDNDQPEQFHFNNLLYQALYVLYPVCPGGNTSFSAGSNISGNRYQWQVNTGSGYTNITNGIVYSGETSSTLLLNNPPTSMYGYNYRCAIINNQDTTYSNVSALKFAVSWTGNIDSTWENTGNWSCAVLPDGNTDVVIPPGLSNYPVINSNAACRSIQCNPNTTITVTTGSSLDIKGPPSGN